MMCNTTTDCIGVLFNCKYFGLHFVASLVKYIGLDFHWNVYGGPELKCKKCKKCKRQKHIGGCAS